MKNLSMRYSFLLLAGLLGVTGLTSGCRTQGVNVVEPARPQASYDMVLDRRVEIDRALARNLEVEHVNQAMRGDLRTVQTTVRNTSRENAQFQYRFEWIDTDGMHIASPASTWVVRTLMPGETASLSSTAPTPRAADFRFQIANLQPSF